MSEPVACRDLNQLDPTFRHKLEAVIADLAGQGIHLLVTETYRSQARQDYLYSLGRTRKGNIVTWTTHSNHTGRKAADVCFLVHKKATYTGPWKFVGKVAAAHGLTWGGNWKNPDKPHLELV
jgi:peptidoglycan LD-endopeptidase CwlK